MPVRPTMPLDTHRLCSPCLRKLSRLAASRSRCLTTSTQARDAAAAVPRPAYLTFKKNYFLHNEQLRQPNGSRRDESKASHTVNAGHASRSEAVTGVARGETMWNQASQMPVEKDATLPHRRRRRRKQDTDDDAVDRPLPLDASAQLSALSSTLPANSFRQRFFTYLSLSKPRLTFLIVLTTTASYSLFPVAVSPLSASMNLSPLTLLNLTTGTALSSASANTLNMLLEPAYDAQMSRTRNRPLVRGLISPRRALSFAVATGTAGVGLLYFGVNPTVAFLSALNVALYAGAYTPLKRISTANTWVGAIVGGIPPLMGWAAAAGQATLLENPTWRDLLFDPATSSGGWLLAGLLFAWQFPHFNALSHPIRHEYAAAGYKMLCSINPARNGRVALRYSLAMFPICAGLTYVGVTSSLFFWLSCAANTWVTREAWRFWKYEGAKGSARGLFWASVWHLPIVLVLAMVCKKGLWERFAQGGFDEEELEEYAQHALVEQDENGLAPGAIAKSA